MYSNKEKKNKDQMHLKRKEIWKNEDGIKNREGKSIPMKPAG